MSILTNYILLTFLSIYYFTNIIHCLPTITRTSRAQRDSQVVSYLSTFGYLPTSQEDNAVDYQPFLSDAIRQFQNMADLPLTGVLDESTIDMMNRPRCGVKDTFISEREKRNANSDNKWQSNLVSWRVTSFSYRLSEAQVLDVLRQAFGVWSAVTNLYFEYRPTGPVDIEIKFASGSHNDGYTFDGRGGSLAHAFFPPVEGGDDSLAGDIHFDGEEPWAVYIHSNGQHLLPVAVHEIGHSLGLQHSNIVGSVMWPWSKDVESQKLSHKLNSKDVSAIQTLYGSKRRRFQRDENSHYLCQQPVNAILRAVDGEIYMFRGQALIKLHRNTLTQVGQPLSIQYVFPGIPANATIDGAVSYQGPWHTEKSYIFVGDKYYRYSNTLELDEGYPKFIPVGWNLTASSFDSVFTSRNRYMLVFTKGDQYWQHTGTSKGAYPGYPRSFTANEVYRQLRPINGAINAGFLHPNGTNYFFTEDQVYRVSYTRNDATVHSMC